MGKPNSFLFCRMHDMRSAFFNAETGEFQYVTLSLSLPPVLEKFTQNNPGFSKNDAVLAICNLLCLDNDNHYTKYQHYTDSYGRDLGKAMDAVLKQQEEFDSLLEANPCDTTIIYLMALCLGVRGRQTPEAMAGAFGLMNRVLDLEEQNRINVDDELLPWITLANFINFEESHDRFFGSPIVGNSPYFHKDQNGNPLKNDKTQNTPSTGQAASQPTKQVLAQQANSAAQTAANKIQTAWNNLELNKRQKVYVILAACAAFSFLISFRFSTFGLSLLALAGAGILLWACIKKKSFPCFLISTALSVFALRYFALDLQRISGTIYYPITFFTVVNRLALYAMAVLIWLATVKKTVESQTRNRVTMGIAAYLTLYEITQLFQGNSFRSFMFSLGKIAFFAAFAIYTYEIEKKSRAGSVSNTQHEEIAAAPDQTPGNPSRDDNGGLIGDQAPIPERQASQQNTAGFSAETNAQQDAKDAPGSALEKTPSGEKTGDEKPRFDFDRFVLVGAQEVSRKPYAKDENEFLSNTKSCFFSVFLNNRMIAADDLAKRFPGFDALVKKILNGEEMSADKLFAERELATNLYQEYTNEPNSDSILPLLAAYAVYLSPGPSDDRAWYIADMILDRVCQTVTIHKGWEELLVSAALWIADRDGYQEAVINKYKEIKDTPEYKSSAPKSTFDSFVQSGAKLAHNAQDDLAGKFTEMAILFRVRLAEELSKEYSAFTELLELMEATNNASNEENGFADSLVKEYNFISEYSKKNEPLSENIAFLVLAAGITALLKPGSPEASAIIERIEQHPDDLFGFPQIALYCSALWNNDHKGFQQKVKKRIEEEKANTAANKQRSTVSEASDEKGSAKFNENKRDEAEGAGKRAEEEAAERVRFEEQRKDRIAKAQAEFVEAENREEQEMVTLTESERGAFIMANSVKLCREKLTGTWVQAGASYADGDILGLWLRGFSYSGMDGDAQTATTGVSNKQFNYRVLVTGDESGKCYLYVSGTPNGFCSTLGEIAFSDDNNFFTLNCRNSSFLFTRER